MQTDFSDISVSDLGDVATRLVEPYRLDGTIALDVDVDASTLLRCIALAMTAHGQDLASELAESEDGGPLGFLIGSTPSGLSLLSDLAGAAEGRNLIFAATQNLGSRNRLLGLTAHRDAHALVERVAETPGMLQVANDSGFGKAFSSGLAEAAEILRALAGGDAFLAKRLAMTPAGRAFAESPADMANALVDHHDGQQLILAIAGSDEGQELAKALFDAAEINHRALSNIAVLGLRSLAGDAPTLSDEVLEGSAYVAAASFAVLQTAAGALDAAAAVIAMSEVTRVDHDQWLIDGATYNVDVANEIGSGGYGTVYRASSEDLGDVAIKRIDYATFDPGDDRELHVVKALLNHAYPNIVALHSAATTDPYVYIVMELAPRSLRDVLDDDPQVSEAEALAILTEIAQGLAQLHSHGDGVIHRDLKPENVLETRLGFKITDFGLSRNLATDTGKMTYRDQGTSEYKSPEQWRGEKSTPATDLYALGCIGYELLTGATPFGPDDQRDGHLNQRPASIDGLSDSRIDRLVRRLLNKDPATRPQTAQAVIERLQSICGPQAGTSEVLHEIDERQQVRIENSAKAQSNSEQYIAAQMAAQQRARDTLFDIVDDFEHMAKKTMTNVKRNSMRNVTADGLEISIDYGLLQFNPLQRNVEGHVELVATLHITADGNKRHDALNLAQVCQDNRYLWKWYFFEDFAKPIPAIPHQLPIQPGTAQGVSMHDWVYELEHDGRGPGSHPLEVGYKITEGPLTVERINEAIKQVLDESKRSR